MSGLVEVINKFILPSEKKKKKKKKKKKEGRESNQVYPILTRKSKIAKEYVHNTKFLNASSRMMIVRWLIAVLLLPYVEGVFRADTVTVSPPLGTTLFGGSDCLIASLPGCVFLAAGTDGVNWLTFDNSTSTYSNFEVRPYPPACNYTQIESNGKIAIVSDECNGLEFFDLSEFWDPMVIYPRPHKLSKTVTGTYRHIAIGSNNQAIVCTDTGAVLLNVTDNKDPVVFMSNIVTSPPPGFGGFIHASWYGDVVFLLSEDSSHSAMYRIGANLQVTKLTIPSWVTSSSNKMTVFQSAGTFGYGLTETNVTVVEDVGSGFYSTLVGVSELQGNPPFYAPITRSTVSGNEFFAVKQSTPTEWSVQQVESNLNKQVVYTFDEISIFFNVPSLPHCSSLSNFCILSIQKDGKNKILYQSQPNSLPTAVPTATPTAVPPTAVPPTPVPTTTPTAVPATLVPTTAIPTVPTLIPTTMPTAVPPTNVPTLIPTAVPQTPNPQTLVPITNSPNTPQPTSNSTTSPMQSSSSPTAQPTDSPPSPAPPTCDNCSEEDLICRKVDCEGSNCKWVTDMLKNGVACGIDKFECQEGRCLPIDETVCFLCDHSSGTCSGVRIEEAANRTCYTRFSCGSDCRRSPTVTVGSIQKMSTLQKEGGVITLFSSDSWNSEVDVDMLFWSSLSDETLYPNSLAAKSKKDEHLSDFIVLEARVGGNSSVLEIRISPFPNYFIETNEKVTLEVSSKATNATLQQHTLYPIQFEIENDDHDIRQIAGAMAAMATVLSIASIAFGGSVLTVTASSKLALLGLLRCGMPISEALLRWSFYGSLTVPISSSEEGQALGFLIVSMGLIVSGHVIHLLMVLIVNKLTTGGLTYTQQLLRYPHFTLLIPVLFFPGVAVCGFYLFFAGQLIFLAIGILCGCFLFLYLIFKQLSLLSEIDFESGGKKVQCWGILFTQIKYSRKLYVFLEMSHLMILASVISYRSSSVGNCIGASATVGIFIIAFGIYNIVRQPWINMIDNIFYGIVSALEVAAIIAMLSSYATSDMGHSGMRVFEYLKVVTSFVILCKCIQEISFMIFYNCRGEQPEQTEISHPVDYYNYCGKEVLMENEMELSTACFLDEEFSPEPAAIFSPGLSSNSALVCSSSPVSPQRQRHVVKNKKVRSRSKINMSFNAPAFLSEDFIDNDSMQDSNQRFQHTDDEISPKSAVRKPRLDLSFKNNVDISGRKKRNRQLSASFGSASLALTPRDATTTATRSVGHSRTPVTVRNESAPRSISRSVSSKNESVSRSGSAFRNETVSRSASRSVCSFKNETSVSRSGSAFRNESESPEPEIPADAVAATTLFRENSEPQQVGESQSLCSKASVAMRSSVIAELGAPRMTDVLSEVSMDEEISEEAISIAPTASRPGIHIKSPFLAFKVNSGLALNGISQLTPTTGLSSGSALGSDQFRCHTGTGLTVTSSPRSPVLPSGLTALPSGSLLHRHNNLSSAEEIL